MALLNELDLSANVGIEALPGAQARTASLIMDLPCGAWPASKPLPLVSSFVPECLRASRRPNAGVPRGLLLEEHPLDWLARARGVGAVSVNIWERDATPIGAAKSSLRDTACWPIP